MVFYKQGRGSGLTDPDFQKIVDLHRRLDERMLKRSIAKGHLDPDDLQLVQNRLGLGNGAFARRLGIPLKKLIRWKGADRYQIHVIDPNVWSEILPVVNGMR